MGLWFPGQDFNLVPQNCWCCRSHWGWLDGQEEQDCSWTAGGVRGRGAPWGQLQVQEGREVFFVLPKRFLRGKFICNPDVCILKVRVSLWLVVPEGFFFSCTLFSPAGSCRQNLWPAGRTVTWSLVPGLTDELWWRAAGTCFTAILQTSGARADRSDGVSERSWAVAVHSPSTTCPGADLAKHGYVLVPSRTQ